ncbi:MAG: YaiI/YqxD family protein [Bacillota bacterium]
MKILIDADACPKAVLQICQKIGRQHNIPVWTVASFNHVIESDYHVVVDSGTQEADIKVANLTEKDDVVITQDWGLAALVLGKKAKCLNPNGKEYRSDSIEFLLEERETKAKVRRHGGKTKGPKKRTAEDDRRFEEGLKRLVL